MPKSPDHLSQQEFDASQCSNEGCTHEDHDMLHLHSRCHLTKGLHVAYSAAKGALFVYCAECQEPVVSVAVARTTFPFKDEDCPACKGRLTWWGDEKVACVDCGEHFLVGELILGDGDAV